MFLDQINKFFQTKKIKVVCVPRDLLPTRRLHPHDLPAAFIVNLSSSDEPGSHWITVSINRERHGVYFCSFGLELGVGDIRHFLQRNCKTIEISRKQLQPLKSVTCGNFATVYAYCFMKLGMTLDEFLSNFSHNLILNDLLIQRVHTRILRFR